MCLVWIKQGGSATGGRLEVLGFFESVITAPPKPSKQTQILVDTMTKHSTQDQAHWEQMLENFDLLFSRVNDIAVNQQR